MSLFRLDYGTLDLVNADGPSDGGFWFQTLAAGFSLGAPQAVKAAVASLLRDGTVSRIVRYDNRTISLTVQILGPDLQALADGEAALSLVVMGAARQRLVVTPPDGFGKPTAFEVYNATMEPQPDDLAEVRAGVKSRTFVIAMDCDPFARSATAITQTLTPAVVTPTVVDDCVSTANWAGSGSYQPALTATTYSGEDVIAATFTSTSAGVKTSDVLYAGTKPTTTFVAIDVNWDGNSSTDRTITLEGNVPQSSEPVMLGTGTFTRYWFNNPGQKASWRFQFTQIMGNGVNVAPWRIANLVASADVGGSGVMSVNTVGSVRSVGSVTLARATALTWALIYADPMLDQFSPAVSATWKYGRAGTYVVYAAKTFVAGDVVTATFTDANSRATITLPTKIDTETAALNWQPIGQVYLGGYQSGLIGAQTVTMTKNGASTTVPALRLFRVADDTTLVYADGFSGAQLVVQAPSAEYPVGAVWADGVDVQGKVRSSGFPTIEVPRTAVYVEANNSAAAPVTSTLTYFAASHTYSAV
jgi:hypothetical protein